MNSRVSPASRTVLFGQYIPIPLMNVISLAIQTQKDDLKEQLSRLYDGPELREHRVSYAISRVLIFMPPYEMKLMDHHVV